MTNRSFRIGATTIELIVIGVAFCIGLVCGFESVERWGAWTFPLGFVGGVVATLLVLLGVAVADTYLWSGSPPHPPTCRSGKCKWEEFEIRTLGDDDAGHFCRCGDRYDKRGRRWVEILPDGTIGPFMIWRPLRGWTLEE
jgi:hypothetical protein